MPTNDPLNSKQSWYKTAIDLDRLGGEYSGEGVAVGIYDDGIQKTHSDLAGNYDASLEVKISGVTASPSVGKHGTAVGGIIAGVSDNGIGGAGIAHGSSITGVDIFSGAASGSGMISAIQQMAKFGVVNNSWNWTAVYSDPLTASFGKQFNLALDLAVDTGRAGLGTIIIDSASNDWTKDMRDANTSEFVSTRFTMSVGAIADNGFVASYSNRGASVLVSAPSSGGSKGITTTDIEGAGGYSSSDSYDYFGGTSAAAPIVSAVAALMLEANPLLGWRDVAEIMALSAEHTGSALGGPKSGTEAFGWSINGSAEFNGGGMHFSNDYGYGQINAYAAVRLSEAYSLFGPAQKSSNERVATAANSTVRTITDNATTSFNIVVATNVRIEHADLTLTLTHPNIKELLIELISPDGSRSIVLTPGTGAAQAGNNFTWTFGSEQFIGELSAGTWQVRVTDTVTGNSGTIHNAKLELFGSDADANNVYTYTEEFGKMLTLDTTRATLQDVDGGNDWINAAAVAADSVINLVGGTNSTIAGRTMTISTDSLIENAVSGDGNDFLIGNDAANVLHGMRGNDIIEGGAGADTIDGGEGIDVAAYDGSDAAVDVDLNRLTQLGGHAEGDSLTSIETVLGSAFNDTLRGNAGANTLEGGNGDDVLEGREGADCLVGGEGFDKASYASATTGATINNALMTVTGTHGLGDTFTSIEGFIGTGFNDIFIGSGGCDWWDGAGGDDIFMGSNGADTITGGSGTDMINYGSSNAGVWINANNGMGFGGFAEGDTFSGIETFLGSKLADTFVGSVAIERFDGNDGDDVFAGDIVGDTINGGNGCDTLDFTARTSSIYVDIATRQTKDGTLFTSIERFVGTEFNDSFYGSAADETIIGGGGNDMIEGMAGADHMEGGNDGDTLVYKRSNAGVVASLSTGVGTGGHAEGDTFSGFEHIHGSAFNDSLVGTTGKNNLWGNDGNDTLDGRGGGDWVYGGNGNDLIRSRAEGWGNNLLDGEAGWDTVSYDMSRATGLNINLTTGITTANVTNFQDTLVSIENVNGSNQDDVIIGSSGANILDGLGGNDHLTAGGGYDTFRFSTTSFGNDTVCDFQDGVDRISFVGNIKNFAQLSITDIDGGCLIDAGAFGTITLNGLQAALLSASDFTFV